MNKIIKNTLILAAITVVSGLVLGAAYEVTKGPIAQTQAKQKQEACQAVYPEADSFEAMDVDQKAAKEAIKKMGTNATVDEVYSAVMDGSEAGYVITVTDKDGYGGDIQFAMGIQDDGTLNGISILSIGETAGLGMRANTPVLSEIEEAFSDTNVEIVNIGDSKRARRIIEGTEEGRNILNVLARHDYL